MHNLLWNDEKHDFMNHLVNSMRMNQDNLSSTFCQAHRTSLTILYSNLFLLQFLYCISIMYTVYLILHLQIWCYDIHNLVSNLHPSSINVVLLECQKYPRSRKSRRKLVSSFRRSFKGKCPWHYVRVSNAWPQVPGPCPVTAWPLTTITSPHTPDSGQPRRTEARVSKFWLKCY